MYNFNEIKEINIFNKLSFFIFFCKLYYFIILISFFLFYLYIPKINLLKVCLCTIGKKENKYVKEFVEYYKKYGVDKIFIYDNNDIEDEKFETVLSDYVKNKFVKIINYRGKNQVQIKALNECYKNNYKKYDWFIMVDIDEYIFLREFANIKSFLNDKRFLKCNLIHFNRRFHTDNNKLFYRNESLFKRFPKYKVVLLTVKSILRGHLFNITIKNQHVINDIYKACNGFGHIINKSKNMTDFNYYYFKHFFCKSTEEYIEKLNKGDVFYKNNNQLKLKKIQIYFLYNKITKKKIKLFEQKTGINLDYFKKKKVNKKILQNLIFNPK